MGYRGPVPVADGARDFEDCFEPATADDDGAGAEGAGAGDCGVHEYCVEPGELGTHE